MRRTVGSIIGVVLLLAPLNAAAGNGPSGGDAEAAGSFELVGHDPLLFRGMNAALAVHGDYAYVGSRTDGTHPNAGVMIVDISDPSSPTVVGQIGPPYEGNPGETSREMRIWPQKEILIVLNLASNCSFLIHACSPTQLTLPDNYRFYDISGENARAPKFIAEYRPSVDPHEFFLWVDPRDDERALLFQSTPGGPADKQMLITDISGIDDGEFNELGTWSTVIPNPETDNRLHSLSVSTDGRRGYIAYLGGGFFIVDTSDFAEGVEDPAVELITPLPQRVHWGDPGAHSAVKLPNRDFALVTDEVYGELGGVLSGHGCPWGWTRLVDIKNPKKPKVIAEYKIAQNEKEFCDSGGNDRIRDNLASFSAHNPTLTRNLAFITWHSGGLQAIDISKPARPKQVAEFIPTPEPVVVTEDPALSSGRDKVVMWSYPIVKDGLIYVVDIRNGLYILKYKGARAAEVDRIEFLEGNSNLGDALKLEKP